MNLTFAFITAFFLTAILTPISIVIIKKMGLLDDPNRHKHPGVIHSKPIPRGGGIPLFIGVLLASIIFLPMTKIIIALFFASFIALVVGVLDDKYDISPYIRFLTNIGVAVFVVFMGANIPFITNPLGGILYFNNFQIPFLQDTTISFLSDLIAILWIVWVMNMLNWSKGV